MRKVRIINAPFSLIGLPSFEAASLKSYLNSNGYNAVVHNIYLNYADYLVGEKYRVLRTTGLGERLFAILLYPEMTYKVSLEYKKYNLDFDELVNKSVCFVKDYIDKLNIEGDDVVIFHMCTKQLMASLYIAKKIKSKNVSIWMTGYNCQEVMGEKLKKCFSFIDKIFPKDIEESVLSELSSENVVIHNNLDFLPTPDYSDFFSQLEDCSKYFKDKIASIIYLQVEFSRGCWWNKCIFCTLASNTKEFREKSIENIIRDYDEIYHKYKTLKIAVQSFSNNRNWRDILRALIQRFPGLKGTFSINFKVKELREYSDFELLKSVGAVILIGTECFSSEYLELLNKGQRVIDNILALKFAERSGVPCFHNLMYALPFEKKEYLNESKEVISYIYHLPPPFDIEEFRLTYNSEIFKNAEKYGIQRISYRKEQELNYLPDYVLADYIPFFYDYDCMNSSEINENKEKWKEIVQEWRDKYFYHAVHGYPKTNSLLYINYHEDFIQITDLRYGESIYNLMGIKSELYKYCDNIRTLSDIKGRFEDLNEIEIMCILHELLELKLLFNENDLYLGLAV